jgi:hypothetical protein
VTRGKDESNNQNRRPKRPVYTYFSNKAYPKGLTPKKQSEEQPDEEIEMTDEESDKE